MAGAYAIRRRSSAFARWSSRRHGIDGLWHVHAVARRERQHPVLRPPVGGQGDGGRRAAVPGVQRTHLANQCVPILSGHLDVRDRDIGPPLVGGANGSHGADLVDVPVDLEEISFGSKQIWTDSAWRVRPALTAG